MVKGRFVCALILWWCVSHSVEAQQNRYMVFFRDKQGISENIDEPIAFLSERAIQRRIEQGIEITAEDLPVSHAYVQGVRATGAEAFFTTRWMNAVLVQCDPALLPALEALSYVERVEFVAPLAPLRSGGRRSFNLRRKNTHVEVETESQRRD